MKKLILTLIITLGITIGASAQNRGLLDRGPESPFATNEAFAPHEFNNALLLPSFFSSIQHGTGSDQDVPLGSGALLLISFGAAYALKKRKSRRRED